MYRSRFILYVVVALSWAVPYPKIEDHIVITFLFFAVYELFRHRRFKAEPNVEPEVPEKARTLSLLDAMPLQEDNS